MSETDTRPLRTPLCERLGIDVQPILTGIVLCAVQTGHGGRQGITMNGAGNIAGLLAEILPAGRLVEEMPAGAAACLAKQ